jgi:hypothetical protein
MEHLQLLQPRRTRNFFWALRGAGASYGIVTQWTYATLPAPPSVISYKISYDPLKAPQVRDQLIKWQDIALSAPDNLSVICTIGHGVFILGDNFYLEVGAFWFTTTSNLSLLRLLPKQFRGTYYGTQTEFQALSSNWTSILSPGVVVSQANNWYDGLVAIGGPLSTNGTQPQQNFFY